MGRFALLSAVIIAASPGVAAADIFKLFGEIHAGGLYGKGTSGDLKDSAFFNQANGAAYGGLVGAELVFADAWISHHQYVNGDGLRTWTQFGLGVHFTVDLGTQKEIKDHSSTYVEFGAGVFFGVGTGAQVHPPLDKAQVSDQGFIGEGRFGFGKHLSSIFDIGLVVPVQYGYFFRDTAGSANNLSTHYQGWDIEGLVALRANAKFL